VQDYKSLCAAVVICFAMVYIQTDTHPGPQTQTAFWPVIWKV